MENNNVIYVSDSESSNVENIAPPSNVVEITTRTPTPTTEVVCAGCHNIYPSMGALCRDHHRGTRVKRVIRTFVSSSLSRDTCLHVSSSSSPAPPRGSGAPAPRILRGGGVHHLIPIVRTAEVINPLPDYMDDRSGITQDLLSRVNLNPLGSVPRPNYAQPNNVDLDLKL